MRRSLALVTMLIALLAGAALAHAASGGADAAPNTTGTSPLAPGGGDTTAAGTTTGSTSSTQRTKPQRGTQSTATGSTSTVVTSGPAVSVFPVPGGHFASPSTQITFRGLPISDLGPISVFGSRTGLHGGHFVSDSDGNGGSFIPVRPFAPLELVTVKTSLNILGGVGGTFSFRIADPAPLIAQGGPFAGKRAPGDTLSFHTAAFHPAAVKVTHPSSSAAGLVFIAPQMGPDSNGPMILDGRGQLVYYRQLPRGESATDFRVQRYRGAPALTWWQGTLRLGSVRGANAGIGYGVGEIFNSAYRHVASVRAGNGLRADLHEFQLTDRGTALLIAYYAVYVDARSVHGSRHTLVLEPVVQEIDIPTGLVLFQWDSLDHLSLTESMLRPPRNPRIPYDPIHVNSATLDSTGNVIISARNTWAAYKVAHRSGAVLWRLGGKRSSFRLPAAARFAFQHTVRLSGPGDTTVTIFDDGAGPPVVHRASRGLRLQLDLTHHTARVIRTYSHTPDLLAFFEGSVQQMGNGDTFVGWGGVPYFSEFDTRGRMIFDGHFIALNASYRAYRLPWQATPATAPDIAVEPRGGRLVVYASWNGATDVARWAVLTGATPDTETYAAVADRSGFETSISVASAPYLSVEAVDASGNVLGVSRTIKLG